MGAELDDLALDHLLARAGLAATDTRRASLKAAYVQIAAMADNVRGARGPMAEPAHIYDFADEDLA